MEFSFLNIVLWLVMIGAVGLFGRALFKGGDSIGAHRTARRARDDEQPS